VAVVELLDRGAHAGGGAFVHTRLAVDDAGDRGQADTRERGDVDHRGALG
jgi:hypothetical protein